VLNGKAEATRSFVLLGSEEEKKFQEERIEIVSFERSLPIAL
jgi:hypothetical protein